MSLREVPLTRNSPPFDLPSPTSKAREAMPPMRVWPVSLALGMAACSALAVTSRSSASVTGGVAPSTKSLASTAWKPVLASGQVSMALSRSGNSGSAKVSERS